MDYILNIDNNLLEIDFRERLTANRQIKVTIDPYVSGLLPDGTTIDTLGETYEFWFTTTYCPLFATVGRVKLMTGPEADAFIDDTIYRLIHKNTMDIIDIYNLNNSTSYAYDYWGCDWQDAPLQMRRYVECKTAYDVLNYARIAGGNIPVGGSQNKTLGDMSIKYGGSNSSTQGQGPPKNKLAELYDCYMSSMRMIKNIGVGVKGYYDQSKGFAHPVREPHHNRVVRGVNFTNSHPRGPWMPANEWRGYYHPRRGF